MVGERSAAEASKGTSASTALYSKIQYIYQIYKRNSTVSRCRSKYSTVAAGTDIPRCFAVVQHAAEPASEEAEEARQRCGRISGLRRREREEEEEEGREARTEAAKKYLFYSSSPPSLY